MDQKINELNAINILSGKVTASLSLDQVVSAAYDQVLSIIEPDLMVIYRRVGDKLIPQEEKPQQRIEPHEAKTVCKCLCGKVAAEKLPIYATDIHSDPRCTDKACKQAGICSFAAIPLAADDEIIGVLGFGSFNQHDFSKQAVLLETIANWISIGLNNAILHEKIQQEKTRLEKILADQAELLSRQRKTEEDLRNSEEKYRELFESGSDLLCVHDLEGNLIQTNLSFKKTYGWSEEELINMNLRDVVPEAYRHEVDDYLKRIIENGKDEGFLMARTKDGREIVIEYNNVLVCNETGPIRVQGSGRDITERLNTERALKKSEKKYRALSIIDDLTRLYNSRYFYSQLKIEIDRVNRYEAPVTLILLDVDNFKVFNDAYGHVEGDQVLMRLGRVIKRCLRKTDSAYRYGGEEFIVLMPETKSEDGILVAERIRTEFKKENFSPIPGKNVHITLSLGVCHYKLQEDMKAFVHRVDQLMYQAKKNGKDRVCHELA